MLSSLLNHRDYADHVYLLPYQVMDPAQLDLEKEANREGLKINTNKFKVLSLTIHRTPPIYTTDRKSKASDSLYIKEELSLRNQQSSICRELPVCNVYLYREEKYSYDLVEVHHQGFGVLLFQKFGSRSSFLFL